MAYYTEREDGMTYAIEAHQDDVRVRGNASAIDEETDREVEDAILARLERGDVWAWASVRVTATLGEFEGEAWLGCCNYEDARDFVANGPWEDLKSEAREDLMREIRTAQRNLEQALDLLCSIESESRK